MRAAVAPAGPAVLAALGAVPGMALAGVRATLVACVRRTALAGVLATLGTCVLGTLVAGVPVAAQPACDDLIVDEAEVLGAGRAAVEEAAQALVRLGADLRVRTYRSVGGDLDRYLAALERSCRSWQAPDGGRKDNLLVVAVAMAERRVAIFFGEQWRGALERQWLRIQTDHMSPRFRSGDVAGGMDAGLRELARVLDAYLHPAFADRGQPPPPAPAQAPPPASVLSPESAPQPLQPAPAPAPQTRPRRAAWPLAVGLGGAALVGGGARPVALAVRRRRRRLAARSRALAARDAAATAFAALDELWEQAHQSAETARRGLGPRDAARLDELTRAAEERYRQAAAANVQASDAFDPSARLPAEAYEEHARAFAAVSEAVADARQAAGALEAFAGELDRLRAQLPAGLSQAEARARQARELMERTEASGYKTGRAAEHIAQAERDAARAQEAWGRRELTASAQALSAALQRLSETEAWLQGLPRLRASLAEELDALRRRAAEATGALQAARGAFESMSRTCAPSAWAPVAGNGTEATKRIEGARELVDRCRSLLEDQSWDEVQAAADRARGWLDEADTLLAAIHALQASLEEARRDAPSEIEAARADLQAAADFIARHDPDVREELEDQLAEARRTLERAAAALRKDRPDYLEVVRLARSANEEADRILAEARAEHEAAERLRRQLASARRDAEAAVSRAAWFIESHHRDCGRRARALLAEARQALSRAASTEDPGAAIRAYGEAEEAAEAAYRQARDDFERAEDDRRERSALLLVLGSSFGGGVRRSSHFGPWGSWGPSSFGGSFGAGGGGGGSSSWGSSGGGGGGSSGW